ncbi:MAG TPA: DUF1552 domain-containing protein [Vicinamibacterales bacterium]|nr:DUF1552 domain-containing protein [Vicinamibacterales bacterium]
MTPLSRRALLRGAGAAIALPFLDAMRPVGAQAALNSMRLVCVEMVHGAAGSAEIGGQLHLWSPAATGRGFDLAPTSLRSLEPFRDRLTIVTNCDCDPAEPFTAKEIGGDHARSSAVFLTQAHPRQTLGADVKAGTSLDQIYAQRIGSETPIPSMQLSIEPVDQGGKCGFGYSCVYTDSISWASPTQPLPMLRDPRAVFDQLFGAAGRTPDDKSILDWILASSDRLMRRVDARDRARLADYLDNVREVERRIQNVEKFNRSGEPRNLPDAPAGIPDSFSEHVKLMFDLQALAFQSDVTRVFAFKLGRDSSNRVYPESGFKGAFHSTSHHSGKASKIVDFAKLNTFHVSLIPYFLESLRRLPADDGGTLLDNTLLLYGSAMGDSNEHNHKRVPFFVVGRAGALLPGGLHLKAPNQTPLANVMLSILHTLGCNDVDRFGDSEGAFNLAGDVSAGAGPDAAGR